jgi:aminodeoxyfutalosine deaminase
MRILAADFVVPIEGEIISSGGIAIELEKIVAVGPLSEIREQFPHIEIESFGSSAILPSFVNAHSHLELTAFRGFLDNVEHDFFSWLIKLTNSRANLSDSEINLSAISGAIEGLRAGVTTFGDIGRFGYAGVAALKTLGLRGTVFQETNFSPDNKTAISDFDGISEEFFGLKQEETRLVKIGISPHSPYTVSPKLFESLTDFSLSHSIPLSIHVAESEMERELLATGKGAFADLFAKQGLNWNSPRSTSVEYLKRLGVLAAKPLLAHCIMVDDTDIQSIAESDSRVVHCPKSNAKFGHSVAPLQSFLDRKIKVGFGSDSVASNNVCDILEESRFGNLISRTRIEKTRLISAKETLRMATLGGAECLGLENEVGSLEVGKQADLIVLNLDNIAQLPISDLYSAILFASSARDIEMTMCAGKELFRNGKTLVFDETSLKAEISAIGKKL